MCGGSDHHGKEAHHQAAQDKHENCSCGRLGGLTFILVVLSMVTVVACDKGEVTELLKSNSAFRGAVSLDLSPGNVNFNLLQSLTTERIFDDNQIDNDLLLFDSTAEEDSRFAVPNFGVPTNDHQVKVVDFKEAQDEGDEEGLSKGRVGHVAGACAVMLAVSAFGVALPHLINRFAKHASRTRRDIIRNICCSFAAGGFWGLALIHVLVEAVTGCANIRYGITFASGSFMNAAFAIAALGYLLMLTIQSIALISSQKSVLRGSGEEGQFRSAMFDAAVASVALTFHSFFEGMVVGMRDTHLLIWVATISVIGHKWAAGFALSMRMEVHQTPKFLKWTILTIFILASPIGALVGMPLGSMETSTSAVVLNALSAGILIFVAGETTAEVFGTDDCSDCSLAWKHPQAECESECKDPCCVNRSVERADTKALARPPSFKLFAAQLLAFTAGLGLVFGMMTLHMRNPGHEHKE